MLTPAVLLGLAAIELRDIDRPGARWIASNGCALALPPPTRAASPYVAPRALRDSRPGGKRNERCRVTRSSFMRTPLDSFIIPGAYSADASHPCARLGYSPIKQLRTLSTSQAPLNCVEHSQASHLSKHLPDKPCSFSTALDLRECFQSSMIVYCSSRLTSIIHHQTTCIKVTNTLSITQ